MRGWKEDNVVECLPLGRRAGQESGRIEARYEIVCSHASVHSVLTLKSRLGHELGSVN